MKELYDLCRDVQDIDHEMCFICCPLFEYPRTYTMEDLEKACTTLESPNTLFKAVSFPAQPLES